VIQLLRWTVSLWADERTGPHFHRVVRNCGIDAHRTVSAFARSRKIGRSWIVSSRISHSMDIGELFRKKRPRPSSALRATEAKSAFADRSSASMKIARAIALPCLRSTLLLPSDLEHC
jgi:hypothetical protein